MVPNRVKLWHAVTFMKHFASLFNVSTENFKLNHNPRIKFVESCRAAGK